MTRHALVAHPVEDDVLVHLVAHDRDRRTLDETRQLGDVLRSKDDGGGIVRRVDHDHARARGDRGAHLVPRHGVVRISQRDHHRRAAADLDRWHVRVIAGLEDDHFVTRMDDGRDRD